jgi:potassium efflux system protein
MRDCPRTPGTNAVTRRSTAEFLRTAHCFTLSAIATLIVLAGSPAWAASPIPAIPSEGEVSAEQIESAITAVEAREGLDEETRNRVIDQLRDAQAQLQNILSSRTAAAAFTESVQTAPAETEELRRRLNDQESAEPSATSLGIDDSTPLPELEQRLATKLAEVAAAEARLAELEAQVAKQAERPAKARGRIIQLRSGMDELSAVVELDPPPGQPAILHDARKLAAAMTLEARKAELNRLDQEILSNSARLELTRAQRDMAARTLSRLRREAAVLQAAVNDTRQSSAAEALQETILVEMAAAGKHPAVQRLAEGNAALIRELPPVAAETERVTNELSTIEDKARQIEQNLARSQQRLEVGGVTQAIGRLFAEERRNLPQVSQYRAEVRERRQILSKIGLAQVRIEEQRRDLTPMDDRVDAAMNEVTKDISDEDELASLRQEVERLLKNRRDLLRQAAGTYTSYIRALGDLDVAQRRLLNAADEYKQFLDQHLMWIPSASVFWINDIRNLPPAIAWAISPISWADTVRQLLEASSYSPLKMAAALLLLAAVLLPRRRLTARFKELTSKVGHLSTDNILLTLQALMISAVRALPIPLLFAVIAWALTHNPSHSDFTAAVARALIATAPFLYNTLLFRTLCAKDGVMQVHFEWSKEQLPVIRKQLDRLTVVGVPIVFVAALAYGSPIPEYRESLGRVAFVIVMIIISGVLHALLHPTRGVAASHYASRPTLRISRLRWLWYVLGAGGPLLLAVAALIGYLYTAAALTGHLIDTFWLVLAIIVVNLVITRWLALTKRKIAWQMALKEREARRASGEEQAEPETPVAERKPLDLDAVDQQSSRLLNAGLFFVGALAAWGIWSEVVPALGVLHQVSLWSQTAMIDGEETIVPVTLADLLLALVIAGITVIASKNLPGLMEIALLQRMTLQPGSRYAINTLLRYVVVTVGVIVVLNEIGWQWSQIQWLVAALSVGLGFGLQEIVANFVSGLVILFERPVRVGDTVTVGQLTGTVSRVRIRATTITDWDRKEIIVPNKSFITEQVINWTLSDPITRIVIPVGISYGSDAQLAHRVMEETLNAMPLVLDEPPPKVYFVGFGESSLDFKLYVHSRELADRLPLTHAVHEQILAALRKNGIEIPFPQRDLHLRSVDERIPAFKQPGDRDPDSGDDA